MPAAMYAIQRFWGSHGTQARYRFVAVSLVRDLLSEPGPKYMLEPPEEPEPAIEARRRGPGCCGARPRRGGREVVPLDE